MSYNRNRFYMSPEKYKHELAKRKAHNQAVKAALGIKMETTLVGAYYEEYDTGYSKSKHKRFQWCIILRPYTVPDTPPKPTNNMGFMHLTFHTGREYLRDNHSYPEALPPSIMDVLYCIRSDNTHGQSFEDWACEMGCDPDSRKAHDIYQACIKQTEEFKAVFPDVNLDEYAPLDEW